MIWFILLFYAIMVPISVFVVVKYRIDPMDDNLWRRYQRGDLVAISCLWPVLWIVFGSKTLLGLIGDVFARIAGSSMGQFLERLDKENDKHK